MLGQRLVFMGPLEGMCRHVATVRSADDRLKLGTSTQAPVHSWQVPAERKSQSLTNEKLRTLWLLIFFLFPKGV